MTDCNAVRNLLTEDDSDALEVRADVQSHLNSCPSCARLRDQIRMNEADLKALPLREMPDKLASDILQAVRAKDLNSTSAQHNPTQMPLIGRLYASVASTVAKSLQLAWRQKWAAVGTAAVGMLVAGIAIHSIPPRYTAEALVVIHTNVNNLFK